MTSFPLRGLVRPAVVLTAVLMLVTGGLYPGIVTLLAQALFPAQAGGSLVRRADGTLVGSALLAQGFAGPTYFHSRPSAAGAGYDATASAGTNKGPTDRKLADTLIAGNVARVRETEGVPAGQALPADMVTQSASGLDPHISPANAALQIARVARARGVTPDAVRAIVSQHTESRQLGFLGEPRVNVLLLNLALDSALARH